MPKPLAKLDPPIPLLFDTIVLNNFLKAGRWDLLQGLSFRCLYITSQVYEELKVAGLERPIREALATGWMKLAFLEKANELDLYSQYSKTFGPGEASSLSLAILRGWAMATDDLAARKAARAAKIPLTGTIGIILNSIKRGLLTLEEGNGLLMKMKAEGYYSPFEELDELL